MSMSSLRCSISKNSMRSGARCSCTTLLEMLSCTVSLSSTISSEMSSSMTSSIVTIPTQAATAATLRRACRSSLTKQRCDRVLCICDMIFSRLV